MRIGILTTSYPTGERSIAGSFVRECAVAFRDRGHQVVVVTPSSRYCRPLHDDGIDVRHVRYAPRKWERLFHERGVPDALTAASFSVLAAPSAVVALVLGARHLASCDLVLSHWAFPTALMASVWCKPESHVGWFHSNDVTMLERMPGNTVLARKVVSSTTATVFTSESLRDRFERLVDDRARWRNARTLVLPMGICVGGDRAERVSSARFTALVLSRLVDVKGLELLPELAARLPDVDFVVAGDGPVRHTLEAAGRSNLRCIGIVRGAEKDACFAGADAFLLPSHVSGTASIIEGMPHAALEAMGHGVPVIASELPALRAAREASAVLTIASRNPEEWAHALRRVRDDRELQSKLAKGATRYAEQFSWTRVVPQIEALANRNVATV